MCACHARLIVSSSDFGTVQRPGPDHHIRRRLEPGGRFPGATARLHYGAQTVRATIKVETIWFRAWTGPSMPAQVRSALGVTVP